MGKSVGTKIIIFLILNVFGFLLATLGVISSPTFQNVNFFWPAGVVETLGAILFGWTGILAGTTFPILSNLFTAPTYITVFAFALPAFTQTFLAYYLFKKMNCDIELKSAKSIITLFFVVVISKTAGALIASSTLLYVGEIKTTHGFFQLIYSWLVGSLPWTIFFTIPIIKIFVPILKEYGFLFGQPLTNKPKIETKYGFKNLSIFFKIFISLLIVGVVPVSVIGAYDILASDVQATGFNINSLFICFGFFGTLMLTGVLTKAILFPIKKISYGIDKMRAGDFDYQIEESSDDELGKLANGFNNMSKTVKENIKQKKTYMEEVAKHEQLAAIGKTAAQVSHDIRSPLTALNIFLKDLPELPEQKRELIRNATNRITDIANNLLSQYKNIENQKSNNNRTTLKAELISCLLDSLISEKRFQVQEKQVELVLETANDTYGRFVNLGGDEFKRMVSNLINNSIESIETAGTIKVVLKNKIDSLKLKIIDNGKGIPANILPEIKQGGKSFNKDGGSGLGIASAIQSIKKWGGEYDICSKEGEGTTVIVTLPIAQVPDWFKGEINFYAKTNIVILDDDESIHDVWESHFSEYLENKQVELNHIYTPEKFKNYCNNFSNNNTLFLVDYELVGSKETGLDLIKQLKIADRSILVTSRYEELNVRDQVKNLGIKIIPKSFAPYVSINIIVNNEFPDLVFIDDSKILTMAWEQRALSVNKKIKTFNNTQAFKNVMSCYNKKTPVYIDSDLRESIKGEEFAKYLYDHGFTELYLATGHDKSSFGDLSWIKEIVGKDSPF